MAGRFAGTAAAVGLIGAGGLGYIAHEEYKAVVGERVQAAQYQDWAVHPDHMPPQPQGEAPKTVQQREAEYLQQASDERHLAATDTDVVKKMAEVTGGLAAIGVGGLLVVVRRSRRGGQS